MVLYAIKKQWCRSLQADTIVLSEKLSRIQTAVSNTVKHNQTRQDGVEQVKNVVGHTYGTLSATTGTVGCHAADLTELEPT